MSILFALFASSCSSTSEQGEEASQEAVSQQAEEGEEVSTEDTTLDGENSEGSLAAENQAADPDQEGMTAISNALGNNGENGLFDGSGNYDPAGRPFPKTGDSWDVQAHILGFDQPEDEFVSQCKNDIKQISAKSRNPVSLQLASSQFQSIVRTSPAKYHWCFFHVVKDLDLELNKPGASFDYKMDRFLTTMNELWVFSTSLTRVTNDQRYLKFTKQRYVEYSNVYFGRKVETIGTPLAH